MATLDPEHEEIAKKLIADMQARRGRSPAQEAADAMFWPMVGLRGIFLLVALGMIWFVPVEVYRCQAAGNDTASCEMEERAWLGLQGGAVQQWSGITGATSGRDRWSMRLLGPEGQVVFEKEQSAVIGTSMASLARRIATTPRSGNAKPWTAWQWPLPIAGFAGASLVFVASGPLGWLYARRKARKQALARGEHVGGVDLFDAAVPLGMLLLAAAAFWFGPVVFYRCTPGQGGATCRIEWRAAGLLTLEALDVPGVASASASSETVRHREQRDGKTRESSETRTTITLLDAAGGVLFEDEQSGALGTRGETLAAGIEQVAKSGSGSATAWQAPWLPLLFGVLMSALAFFPLLSFVHKLTQG